jgi:hypothetical protein
MKKDIVKSVYPILILSLFSLKKTMEAIIRLAMAVKNADIARGFIFSNLSLIDESF